MLHGVGRGLALQIIFIGPPGAGKGTQCRRLASHLGASHLSTGEILRSPEGLAAFGKSISDLINSGQLAPDEIAMRIFIEHFQSVGAQGSLYDGFPRTLSQAEMMDEYLASQPQKNGPQKINAVIHLEIDRERLVRRLLDRAKQESRADDTEATIVKRLSVYDSRTKPVIEHYAAQGLITSVDGNQSADAVFTTICQAITA